jgi:hypothetical protein
LANCTFNVSGLNWTFVRLLSLIVLANFASAGAARPSRAVSDQALPPPAPGASIDIDS